MNTPASSSTRSGVCRLNAVLATLVAITAPTPRAVAADVTWINATTSQSYMSGVNWSTGTIPGGNDVAVFVNNGSQTTYNLAFSSPPAVSGTYTVGAISITSARTSNNWALGNSSATQRNGVLVLNGQTVGATSNVIIANASGKSMTFNGVTSGTQMMAITLGNATDNVILVDSSGGITISSTITGANRTLTLAGSGTGTLSLSAANTYSGTMVINAATNRLLVGNANALGADGNALVVTSGTLDLGSNSVLVGSLTGGSSGRITNSTAATTATLTSTSSVTGTFAGAIVNGSGTVAFTKQGLGTLVFTGTNTYNGLTTISAGALQIGDGGTTGSIAGNVSNSGTLSFNRSNALIYSGTISGGGAVVQAGNGDTTLAAASTHSGPTTLSAGTLRGGNDAAFGSGTLALNGGTVTGTGASARSFANAVTVGGNVQFGDGTGTGNLTFTGGIDLGGQTRTLTTVVPTTFSGAVSNGNLTKAGAAALTLSGNSGAFAGTTTVSAGTLVVSGNLGGSLSVSSGATLAGTGTVGTVTVTTGATLSPGNSPGVLTTGDITWAGGGNYNWQLYDASLAAGTGWDLVAGGALTITSDSTSRFNVNLWSLSGLPNTSGTALNFSFTTSGTYTIGTFSSITGFSADAFSINTSATNGTGGFAGYNPTIGGFTLVSTGTSIDLVYTHTPPSSYTYIGGTGTWSDTANWSPADTPEGNVGITFGGPGGTATNDLTSGTGPNELTSVTGLTFSGSAGGYTLAGNAFTLGVSGTIANNSAVTQTIQNGITLGGAGTIDAAIGNLTLQSGTVDTAGFTLTLQGSATTTLASVTGTGGLVKSGPGGVVLTGAVAAPTVSIDAGSLSTNGANLIVDSAAVTVASGASLALGGPETVGALAGAGTVNTGGFGLTTGGLGTSGTFSGEILGGGSLTKTGTGSFSLTGTTAFGSITVSGGSLIAGATSALPTAASVSVTDSGRLRLGASGTFGSAAQTITLSSTQSTAAVLENPSATSTTLLSGVNLAAASTNQVNAYTSGTFTLAGNVTGSGTLIKAGAGNLILAGTANTHSGATEVTGGTLTVAAGSALGSGDLRINASLASTAVLALNESASVGNLTSGYVSSGNNQITVASGKTLTVNQTATGTFGAPSGSQTTTITGGGGFTKAGAGTLTLAGSNSYTGATTVTAGQLVTAAAGAISTDVTVSSAATLTVGAAQTFTSLAGAGTLAAGSSPLTFSIAGTSTFAGTLTGNASSSLTKTGAGTMNFTGTTSGYAGTVTVNQGSITGLSFGSGTVALDGGSAYGDAGGTITNAIVIGGPIASAFSGYWNFGVAAGDLAVTTVTGTGVSFGSVAQGNNNGTTTVSGNTTPSSGYTGASGNFNAQAAARTGALATGTNGSAYFEFTVTGSAGYTFDVSSLTFGSRSTSTGPVEFSLRADTAGTYGTSLGTASGLANSTWALESITVAGTTSSGAVVYRVYGYGSGTTASQNTANWRIDDLTVSGTSYAATRPASAGTLGIAGAGAVTYTGNVTVAGTATLEAVAGGTATFSGAISGATGALTKSGLGTVILTGSNTYGGGVTVSAGTLVGTTDSLQGAIANSAALVFEQSGNGTYAGLISGVGSLTKTGAGTVTLIVSQSFSGPTTISAGALALSGSGGLASPLIKVAGGGLLDVTGLTGGLLLGSNQTLAGTGTVAGHVVVGGGATVAPGNSPGTMTAGSMEFASLGNFNWQIFDIAGGAGTGWDLLSGTGTLDITASSSSKFNVNLWSLSGLPDTSGPLAGFNASYDYFFKFAQFTGGITGFSADKFSVNTTGTNGTGGFANSFNGTFSVVLGTSVGGSANDLYIVYASVPEPSTLALASLGLAAVAWATRRRRGGRSA